jgi:hypothetical protein
MPIDVTVRTLYWMPGCSSCLRLKEFVERTGLSVEEVNIDAKPERRAELENAGAVPPAIRVGDRFANGLNLNEVAELLGVEYDLAPPLPPAALYARYLAIQDAFAKVLATAPEGFLDRTLPGRNRNMLDVAAQVSAVLRSFLAASETGKYDVSSHRRPEDVRTIEDLRGRADETVELFTTWWDRGGFDNPLDNVVDTFWGHRTLQEILEREVWHSAHHLRQLVYELDEMGVEHGIDVAPLIIDLPMPTRVHD